MTDKPKQETAVTQLAPKRMQLAEHAFNNWHITPENGTPIEALLDTKYFANCVHSHTIKAGDRIHCDAEDGSYSVVLFVRDVGRMYCKTALLSKALFGGQEASAVTQVEGYEIKFRGQIKKWCVKRIDDGKEVQDGLGTRDAAGDWIREHLKALAA